MTGLGGPPLIMRHRWARAYPGRHDRNQAAKLRDLMTRHGVTVEQLAEAAGETVSAIESVMDYARNDDDASFTAMMLAADLWIKQGRIPDCLTVARRWAADAAVVARWKADHS